MSLRKSLFLIVAAALLVGLVAPPAGAAQPLKPEVWRPVAHDVSIPLRDMVPLPAKPGPARQVLNHEGRQIGPTLPSQDNTVQGFYGNAPMPAPSIVVDALSTADNNSVLGYTVTPPDTEGAIGPNHYLQFINSVFSVFDKTTGNRLPLAGGATVLPGNQFWAGFSDTECATRNDGDPIVLYDEHADRWMVSQFAILDPTTFGLAPPYKQCVAISVTGDPTGSYYRYSYNFGTTFPDYPKFGVWSDAYYMTANQYNSTGTAWLGCGVLAFERDKMLLGLSANVVYFNLNTVDPNFGMILPADLDGAAPPAGTPGIFAEWDNAGWLGDANDTIRLWNFTVDWTNPGASTFGVAGLPNQLLTTADVDPDECTSRSCIPMPSPGEKVDAIAGRLMHRMQYRNFGDHETLVTSMTVDANGADHAGVHWYNLQRSGGAWSMHDEGTYAPDADHRWMPSAAMDVSGDIAVGFSVSSLTTYPSIRYAGRLPGDPAGQLSQAETTMIAGSGVINTGYSRWGDYSMMDVDPTDQCTFWYTQEYVKSPGGGWNWSTAFGAFKFPGCSAGPTGTLTGRVTSSAGVPPNDGIAGAMVTAGATSTTTDPNGYYTFTLPVGTYDMTATKLGYTTGSATGLDVTNGGTTTQDFVLDPTGSATVDGFVTAAGHGWPLWAKIEVKLAGSPVATLYTSPWNGYYETVLPQGYDYDFTVTSMYTGYVPETRPVTVTPADQIQNFTLNPASGNTTYSCYLDGGINEHFEGAFPPAGWTVKNNGTIANNVWKRNDQWNNRANETGGTGFCADADSDAAGSGSGNFDTELWSPVVKLPATPRNISFQSRFRRISDTGTFEISTNGGSSWTVLGTFNVSESGTLKTYDLTAYAGMNVIFRWHYMSNGSWQYYWEIDDVQTATIPPPPGPPSQLWSQNWDGVTVPALPAGWAAATVTGTATWTNVTSGTNPTLTPDTPPNMMKFNSYDASSTYSARLYTTTGTDLSAGTGIVRLRIYHDTGYSSNDRVQVQASTDGGTTWQNMGAAVPRYNGTTGWADAEVNFAGMTGPTTDVRVGLLGISAFGNNTYVDATSLWIGVVPVPVTDNPTLSCSPVEGSMVAGFVTEENTAAPIIGAHVAETNGPTVTTMDTPVDSGVAAGFYYLFSPKLNSTGPDGPSMRIFTASKAGYGDVVKNAILVPNTINRLDFALPSASLSLSPSPLVLESRMYHDNTPADDKTREFSIVNTGGLPANVKMQLTQLPNTYVPQRPHDPNAASRIAAPYQGKLVHSLKGIPLNVPARPPAAPFAAGAVIQSWPTGLVSPWGMGFAMGADHAWVSNISLGGGDDYDYEYTRLGTATGGKIDTTGWNTNGYAADMAYNKNSGMLWQIDVAFGPTNTIHELDPVAGTSTGNTITVGGLNASYFYTALAYDPESDTFFLGGWGDGMIFRFDSTGTILQSFSSGLSVAGMAYNPATGHLFVIENSPTDTVTVLDVNNAYATVGSFTIAGFGNYAGAGLEFDCNGHLWAVNQVDLKAYEVDSSEGYPCSANLPWVTINPTEGVVPAHDSLAETVEFFAEGANHYGLWRATLAFQNTTPTPLPNAPVYFTKAFNDIPEGYWADAYIHGLAGVGLTVGIGGGNYGPDLGVTRAQMAVFLVRAIHGPAFRPPSAVGIFADVDLSDYDWAADWIEQLYNDGVTMGCGTNGAGQLLFCPANVTLRGEEAAFICRAKGWAPYANPTPTYADVPMSYWAYGYIEKITQEGVTTGCGVNGGGDPIYCPDDDMDRANMAKFMVLAWNIPYYEHPPDL